MTPTELDLPLMPSAEQIRRREFATIRRGYDPDQVRDYLHQVATQVETLERQLREARLHADVAQPPTVIPEPEPESGSEPAEPEVQVDPYETLAARMADVIRAADAQAEKLVGEAKGEASRSLEEARSEADRIRTDAQSRAEQARQRGDEVLDHAKKEAERVLSSLSTRREHLVGQLQQMQSRLLGVAQELETALGSEDEIQDAPGTSVGPTSEGTAPSTGDPLDPHYEDLWITSDPSALNITDIPAMDIDFDGDEAAD